VECRVTGSCIRMTRDHDDRHLGFGLCRSAWS
jgi:hypothetical protein